MRKYKKAQVALMSMPLKNPESRIQESEASWGPSASKVWCITAVYAPFLGVGVVAGEAERIAGNDVLEQVAFFGGAEWMGFAGLEEKVVAGHHDRGHTHSVTFGT